MLVLIKGRRINSEINIEMMLRPLRILFYEECVRKRGLMIWMDDGIGYYTSKRVITFCRETDLLRMDWSAQSLNLNPIENLWRIIKVRVTARRH